MCEPGTWTVRGSLAHDMFEIWSLACGECEIGKLACGECEIEGFSRNM
jgi:hypothetical protein